MRIIYCLSEDLNRTSGGSVHFLAVARAMRRLGHQVLIMCPQFHRTMRRFPPLRSLAIPLPGRNRFSVVLYRLLAAMTIPFVWAAYRPEALLVRGGGGLSFPIFWMARLLGIRVVVEVNGIAWEEMRVRKDLRVGFGIIKLLAKIECRSASRVIAVTPQIKDELVRTCGLRPEKVFVVQNGADPEEFGAGDRLRIRRALGLGPDEFVVGFIGQFTAWHGTLTLAEAAGLVPEELRSRLRIVMVGNGKLWHQTRAACDRCGDLVLFPGHASRQDVKDYLAAIDVGISINTNRTIAQYGFSPLKFWEYLAAGLPVIVQDNCNLTPIVEKWDMGLVVRDIGPRTVADAICRAYRERDRMAEVGKRNRQLVRDRFSWTHIAERVVDVLAGTADADWPGY